MGGRSGTITVYASCKFLVSVHSFFDRGIPVQFGQCGQLCFGVWVLTVCLSLRRNLKALELTEPVLQVRKIVRTQLTGCVSQGQLRPTLHGPCQEEKA